MHETREPSVELGHRTVTEAAVMTFGCLTGDDAQMHFDHEFGPANGMGGTIAHGLLSAAWSLGALTRHAPERLAIGDPHACVAGYRMKFSRRVYIGDRFSLRWVPGQGPCIDGLERCETLDTEFEVLNQRGEVTGSGAVTVCLGERALPPPPALMAVEPWQRERLPRPAFAEDLLEAGPRGESPGWTVTEADVVGFARFTGERNPLYCNEVFARSTPFGGRIASPMLCFCLAFSDYLDVLLSVAMTTPGLAGPNRARGLVAVLCSRTPRGHGPGAPPAAAVRGLAQPAGDGHRRLWAPAAQSARRGRAGRRGDHDDAVARRRLAPLASLRAVTCRWQRTASWSRLLR